MGHMITKSASFCKKVVEDTPFATLITKGVEKGAYKTIITIFYNMVLNVGPHDTLITSIQCLGVLYSDNVNIDLEEKQMIWELILLWFFHPKNLNK